MRILLIEDDLLIGEGIQVGLEKSGFTIDWITDGLEGKEALDQTFYDAVILDLGLPGKDGLSILKEWRNAGKTEPVLILTAQGNLQERVNGLNSGADDYLGKPFSLLELVARIRALIRRNYTCPDPLLTHGDISFNQATGKAYFMDKELDLPRKELLLLELFLLNQGRIMSREIIEDKMYSWDDDIQSNTVEVHIHNLRRKLERSVIRTVHKIGYIMDEES